MFQEDHAYIAGGSHTVIIFLRKPFQYFHIHRLLIIKEALLLTKLSPVSYDQKICIWIIPQFPQTFDDKRNTLCFSKIFAIDKYFLILRNVALVSNSNSLFDSDCHNLHFNTVVLFFLAGFLSCSEHLFKFFFMAEVVVPFLYNSILIFITTRTHTVFIQ